MRWNMNGVNFPSSCLSNRSSTPTAKSSSDGLRKMVSVVKVRPAHPFVTGLILADTSALDTYIVLESGRRFEPGPPTRVTRRTSLPSRTSVHLPITIRTTEADYMACAEVMEQKLRKLASAHSKTLEPRGSLPLKDYPT